MVYCPPSLVSHRFVRWIQNSPLAPSFSFRKPSFGLFFIPATKVLLYATKVVAHDFVLGLLAAVFTTHSTFTRTGATVLRITNGNAALQPIESLA